MPPLDKSLPIFPNHIVSIFGIPPDKKDQNETLESYLQWGRPHILKSPEQDKKFAIYKDMFYVYFITIQQYIIHEKQ